MQESRNGRSHNRSGLEPIASLKHMRFASLFARHQGKGRGPGRPFFPQGFDFIIGFLEVADGSSPVTEHHFRLFRSSTLAGNGKNLSHALRNGISNNRPWVSRRREPESTQVIVHQIIAVPAAVVLGQLKKENCSTGKSDVRGTFEYRFARLIAAPWPGVDAPGSLVFSVNCKRDRAGYSVFSTFIIEVWFQRC